MMKRRFKRVMSYFFNFDSNKTPNKKSRKGATNGNPNENSHRERNSQWERDSQRELQNSHKDYQNSHREYQNSHLLSESEYIIRRLNETNGLTPREVAFSRYTPLPRIGESLQDNHGTEANQIPHQSMPVTEVTTSHYVTYKISPVQVRKPKKVTYQLSPLATHRKERSPSPPRQRSKQRSPSPPRYRSKQRSPSPPRHRPKLRRSTTYVVRDPVIIKGPLLEYLKIHDNMVTTRVHAPEKPSTKKRDNNGKGGKVVAKPINAKQRLNEVKEKFKRQQEELKASGEEKGFWLEL
uniref:Uncharacterized protein n=1 Tax=Cacopsylla melanoneura TaxID=428564 RepID=A0A8D8Z3Z1_9HEMI